jgi:hypothetical protein
MSLDERRVAYADTVSWLAIVVLTQKRADER